MSGAGKRFLHIWGIHKERGPMVDSVGGANKAGGAGRGWASEARGLQRQVTSMVWVVLSALPSSLPSPFLGWLWR